MRPLLLAALLSLTLSVTSVYAAAPRGPVHSEKAAEKVGSESAWLAGEKATQDGDMWEVGPKNPGPDALGSNIVFRIAATDGQMLGYYSP